MFVRVEWLELQREPSGPYIWHQRLEVFLRDQSGAKISSWTSASSLTEMMAKTGFSWEMTEVRDAKSGLTSQHTGELIRYCC